jgi:simple sugar transport system permease protein
MESFLNATIINSTPIILAACGALLTQLAGWLNIGLEGLILVSAFFAVAVSAASSSLILGTLVAVAVSMLLAVIIFALVRYLRANLFVVGIATNLFAAGFTVMLTDLWLKSKGTVVFSNLSKPPVLNVEFLGKIGLGFLNNLNLFELSALMLPMIVFLFLNGTASGVKLRACGLDAESAFYAGVSVDRLRFFSFLISGLFAGLAGASLSLPLGAFVANMSGGRGWIALVSVIMGRGKPVYVMLSAIFLGAVVELSLVLQVSTQISPKLLLTLPYFISFTVLCFFPTRLTGSRRD